jgi:hypothetical protein
MRSFLFMGGVMGVLFFSPAFAFAGEIRISEVDPKAEFIELENTGEEAIDISEWKVSELSGGMEKQWEISTYTNRTIIEAGAFAVLSMNQKINDTGDTVRIYDANNELIDTLIVPRVQDGKSYALGEDGNFLWTSPTPGEANFSADPDPTSTQTPEPTPEETPEIFPIPDSGELVINEIFPNPSSESEFVELKNVSEKMLSLDGVRLEDAVGIIFSFAEGETLEAGNYAIAEISGSKLNNTGDTVKLFSNSVLLEEYAFGNSEKDESFARIPDGEGEFISSFSTTKGARNPDPQIFSDGVIISEFLPNPVGDDEAGEWIELWNGSEDTVDISGWKIQDASGSSYIFSQGTFLVSQEYKIFPRTQTGITLNNSDESLLLFDPNGEKRSELGFGGSASEGVSIALFESGSALTSKPTPEKENVLSIPSSSSSGSSSGGSSSKGFFRTESIQNPLPFSPKKILFTEISIKGKENDFVEMICVECNGEEGIDLGQIRLGDDDELFQIPIGTIAKTGDILLFLFVGKDQVASQERTDFGWKFLVPSNGLTSTDESIYLIDDHNTVLDALCWSNRDKTFSSEERRDLGLLITHNAWTGEGFQYECVDSSLIKTDWVIKRNGTIDTNTSADFCIGDMATAGKAGEQCNNQDFEKKVQIEQIEWEKEHLQIFLKNIGEQNINMQHISIWNKNDQILVVLDPLFVAPSEHAVFSVPLKKSLEKNLLLTLRDSKLHAFDFLCANIEPQPKNSSTQKFISEARQKGFFQFALTEECLSFPPQEGIILIRNGEKKMTVSNFFIQNKPIIAETRKEKTSESKKISVPKIALKNRIDSDGDQIPDHWEIALGSDPMRFDLDDSPAKKAYQTHLLERTNISFSSGFGKLLIEGSAEQGAKLFLGIDGKTIPIEIIVKASGKFDAEILQALTKGSHSFSFSLETPEGFFVSSSTTQKFSLSEDTFFGELATIEITKILPNPDGIDKNNELVVLRNPSTQSGWTREWRMVMNGKEKKMPPLFWEAGEEKVLRSPNIPSLKNTNAIFAILSFDGSTVHEITWEKARSDEYFGIDAPKYATAKTKKTISKKIASAKKPIATIPLLQEIQQEGVIVALSTEKVLVQLKNGETREILFSEHSQFFFSPLYAVSDRITFSEASDGSISSVFVWKDIPTPQKANGDSKNIFFSPLSFGIIGLVLLFFVLLWKIWYTQKNLSFVRS